MPSVQIKHVPDDTHAVLRRRAAARHQSLQEYLLQLLNDQANQMTMEEWVERVSSRRGGSLSGEEAAAIIRRDRDSH